MAACSIMGSLASPTATPTAGASETPSATATPTVTATPTEMPTLSPTATAIATPSPSPPQDLVYWILWFLLGEEPFHPLMDINNDGVVDIADWVMSLGD